MKIASLIRKGVKLADKLTATDMQSMITLRRSTGENGYGALTYGELETIPAIVDYTSHMLTGTGGESINVAATVLILDATIEPISVEDLITLPNGYTGPIISAPGSVNDPSVDRPFVQEILIGRRSNTVA